MERMLEILKFWHLVEFFIPFDLDEITSCSNARYKLSEQDLAQYDNASIPWLDESALKKAGGSLRQEYRYDLYLLPFSKNEISKISEKVFSFEKEENKIFQFEENYELKGETCFAKLSVNSLGFPALEKISISTLPWSLGKLAQTDLKSLSKENFDKACLDLKKEILLLDARLKDTNKTLNSPKAGVLTAEGLRDLLTIFKHWAGYTPDHSISIIFQLFSVKPKKRNLSESVNLSEREKIKQESNSTNEEEEKAEPEVEIEILNSFFISDLEKIIKNEKLETHTLLHSYLLGTHKDKKKDLYKKENHCFILKKSHPDYLNRGHWFHPANHFMSLMQQFAINESFFPSNNHSLFSVNGPPGTGKTTMMKDIIAENIVRRARILSKLDNVSMAFKEKMTVTFNHGVKKTINVMQDDLCGFEMIVVSTNNAAVENVTKDFPLKKSLAKEYKNSVQYLAPVACKISADHSNNKVNSLSEKEEPWGLVSIALGSLKNRLQFCQRVFFAPEEKENINDRINEKKYLTIWEWKNQYQGPSFQEAQQYFHKAEKILDEYLEELKQYIVFTEMLDKLKVSNQVMLQEIEAWKLEQKVCNEQVQVKNAALEKISQEKSAVQANTIQHKKFKPSFFQYLLCSSVAKDYLNQLNKLSSDWCKLLDKERSLKDDIDALCKKEKDIQHKLSKTLELFEIKRNEYEKLELRSNSLQEKFLDVTIPPKNGDLEDKTIQIKAIWQNETLNELRARLFISALQLHEAWLFEALKNCQFSENLYAISYLLSNKKAVRSADECAIWQSFFMWVPVISSTCASIGRQFKNIGPKAFGWLLVDEAGQAVPQSLVGALWRTQKAIIVGDPLQIEPVFTIPPYLVEGLAKHTLKSQYEKWLPTITSAQILADDANIMGTNNLAITLTQWMGSPLRVHRRCLEPMFSIANAIAYEGKMINCRSKDAQTHSLLGESCWYDIKGKALDKQYVHQQGEFLLKILLLLCQNQHSLPNLFIITPFRQIKNNLQQIIEDASLLSQLFSPIKIKKWCTKHIGTIHTFQGKEAEMVILVLGADNNNKGAVNWACSKPNLLNVALTRAKNHIYVIGDWDLWSAKPYFSSLALKLPRKFDLQI